MSTNQVQEGGAVNFASAENHPKDATSSIAAAEAELAAEEATAEKTEVKPVGSKESVKGKDTATTQPALSSIDFSLWVTADLSNRSLFDALDAEMIRELKSAVFPVRGGSDELAINLYDPFTSGRSKGEADAPAGVFRNALTGLLAVSAQVNNRALTYVGDEKKIMQVVSALAGRMTQDLTRALEISPKTTPLPEALASFGTLSSFINLGSWVSASTDDAAVGEVSIYSNLSVAAPAVLDSKDPQKRVQRLISTLERASHDAGDATDIYVAVAFDSASLFDNDRLHDLAIFLADALGFNVLSRHSVLSAPQEWLPADKVDALFPATADLLFFRELFPEVEEEETEETSETESE